ncbi:MAG: Cdc6/Cdc18 family protein [Promethearchaeota archaeon]
MFDKHDDNGEAMPRKSDSNSFIDNIIDDYISTNDLIFKDRRVLLPGYMPEEPLHRHVQIKQLLTHLKPCFSGGCPSNLLVYGKTGTGKTYITRFISKKILEKCKLEGLPCPHFIYINVQVTNTKYRILVKIGQGLGLKLPHTGIATDHVLEKIKARLKEDKKGLVVIIDEIDLLIRTREKDDLLYLLTRISEDEPMIQLSIIGISNNLRFRTFLGIRVLSSLNAQEIVFPPYSSKELEEILMDRARLAFKDGVYDDSLIKTIAAINAREHGDARKAISLLLKVGEIAKEDGSSFIDAEHVLKAKEKLEYDTLERFISTLPEQYKLVIIGISNAHHYYKCNVNTGSLLGIYNDLVSQSDLFVSNIKDRRLLQLLNNLKTNGIIDLTLTSDGRYGRYNIAQLLVDRETIERIFSKDQVLKKLLNHVPKLSTLDSFLKHSKRRR